jgi:hypothetical protein
LTGGSARQEDAMLATITVTSREKLQAGLDKLLDLPAPDPRRARTDRERLELVGVQRAYEVTTSFPNLAKAFVEFGGDPLRMEFRKERATEEINSATFALALGNTIGRRIVADYKTQDYGEDLIISNKKPVKDLREQAGCILGYYGDLADVDPEKEDYTEFGVPGELYAPYSMNQKGNLLTVTERALINDDIGLIRRLILRGGRAARRAHARFCWAPFLNNSAIYDSVSLFNVAHGNLGAEALSTSPVRNAITAIRQQTEMNSGERIQFGQTFHLWVPLELEFVAAEIRPYGPPPDERDLRGSSGVARVIPHVNALFTDPADWILTAPPDECELMEMAYVNGREEPEVVLASEPSGGLMFVRDALRYKIRHEYGGSIVEYRGAYKSVVA